MRDFLFGSIIAQTYLIVVSGVRGAGHRKSFRELYLAPALEAGLVEFTVPDKPNSRLQKYRLTKAGKAGRAA